MLPVTTGAQGTRWAAVEEVPVLEFHIGPSGSGKTHAVMERYKDAYWWYCANGGSACWLDGYEGEEVIVFDEFRGELPFAFASMLFSCQQRTFRRKGEPDVQVLAKKFVFTSTVDPLEWYPDDAHRAWARRVADFGVTVAYS
jgi:hypothetical protein